MSIKDRSLNKASLASHRFIVLSAYLGMGAGKTCCSLVADPALSGPTDRRWRWWRSLHHTESGTQEVGAWSPSLDGDLDPSIGVEWVGLVYAWGTNRVCVLGYPARIHWFVNHRVIRYDLSTV